MRDNVQATPVVFLFNPLLSSHTHSPSSSSSSQVVAAVWGEKKNITSC